MLGKALVLGWWALVEVQGWWALVQGWWRHLAMENRRIDFYSKTFKDLTIALVCFQFDAHYRNVAWAGLVLPENI